MARFKRPVRARNLQRAFAGKGSGSDPYQMVLDYREASGLAAVDGHEVTAYLTLPELGRVVGAIPAAILTEHEDMKAVIRVSDLLRRQAR